MINALVHRLGSVFPDGAAKDWLRRLVFPILFTPIGSRRVLIGPPNDKEALRISHFPLFYERLGEREIEGYLKEYNPKPGRIVVNAGGYHGYFAMYLSRKIGPSGHVYCFEPDSLNAKIIKKNLERNSCHNVTVIEKGLWNANSRMAFETRGSSSRISSTKKAATTASFCSMDQELKRLNVHQVNFISMDIEGAEIQAIEGAKELIKNSPGISLAIASYHVVDNEQTSKHVEKQLKNLGLNSYTAFPRHLTTYATTR